MTRGGEGALDTDEIRLIERQALSTNYQFAIMYLMRETQFGYNICAVWLDHLVAQNPDSELARTKIKQRRK